VKKVTSGFLSSQGKKQCKSLCKWMECPFKKIKLCEPKTNKTGKYNVNKS